MMLIISNNCCGGWLYKALGLQFNNPFMWMVCPLSSIYNVMMHFTEINWANIQIKPSQLKENTFKICVDSLVEIHYVHYLLNPQATKIIDKKSYNANLPIDNNEVEYCYIWEYVVNKYLERVKRMVALHSETPVFLISDLPWYYMGKTPNDILSMNSPYKRILLTESSTYDTYENCHIIPVTSIKSPMTIIHEKLSLLKSLIQ